MFRGIYKAFDGHNEDVIIRAWGLKNGNLEKMRLAVCSFYFTGRRRRVYRVATYGRSGDVIEREVISLRQGVGEILFER
jgi:hypothetical protein